ncbi:MAG: efflux RND transporter periplasmic adaptor subunit [Isosphaeraceae bacterium]
MTTLSTSRPEGSTRKTTKGRIFRLALVATASLVVPAASYFAGLNLERLREAARTLYEPAKHAEAAAESPAAEPRAPVGRWDGLVRVDVEDQKTIGFEFAEVAAQKEPIRLELNGRTAYDPDTITKIRPRFDTRVERVFASLGQRIKVGEPLVELYSTDLAAAKTDFQTKYVQWQHDLKLYNLRQRLVETGAISQQLWVDTQNDVQKSRLEFTIASDKLRVFYEVPPGEIDPLLAGLSDNPSDVKLYGSVTEKARMTMRAKHDGIVISREVVPGNYYETTDVLMEIAPLDHLWVWVNVFEVDQDKVQKGQKMDIQFPFLAETIPGTVDFVATEVSKDTRAVKIRASIRNLDARLKSDMLVKAMLEIPPVKGHTVIPRLAMVAINGENYAFVRVPSPKGAEGGDARTSQFERVSIRVAQESTDHVVVSDGLKPGQTVVTVGSLILSQLYEDQKISLAGFSDAPAAHGDGTRQASR